MLSGVENPFNLTGGVGGLYTPAHAARGPDAGAPVLQRRAGLLLPRHVCRVRVALRRRGLPLPDLQERVGRAPPPPGVRGVPDAARHPRRAVPVLPRQRAAALRSYRSPRRVRRSGQAGDPPPEVPPPL